MTKLNALAPWYGSKRQMSGRIIEALGPHTAYWEPFCGSLAVTLAKPTCRMEVVNDLNGSIVNLARVVADDTLAPQLFDRLTRTAFCKGLYDSSQHWLKEGMPPHDFSPWLDWAYHYFVVSWMGRNGLVGTTNELTSGFCKRHTSGGGDPATRFRNVVENIPAWWTRLRRVTILCEDGIALCDRIEDREGTATYVDSPYVQKSASYLYDFEPQDHLRLATSLGRFKKTRVVVSYYDHPMLDELYPASQWTKTPVDVQKNMSVRKGAMAAPEVLLVNRLATDLAKVS